MAKTKYSAISTTMLMMLLVFMAGTALLAMSSLSKLAYATTVEKCTNSMIVEKESSLGKSVDRSKATSLAVSNPEFQSKTQGRRAHFSGIFYVYKFDDITCNVNLATVNVVYSYVDLQGYHDHIVVAEQPTLTNVINVTEQIHNPIYGAHDFVKYSGEGAWSGYELAGDGNSPHTTNVWEATGSWQVPTVSVPFSGDCTSTTPCDAPIWAGLEDDHLAADSLLAQTGTDEKIQNCNISCTYSYNAWYEFLTDGPVNCMTVDAGDSVSADVYNEGGFGGSNTAYDTYLNDAQLGYGCGYPGYTYSMTSPLFGDFVVEQPSGWDLANFGSVSIGGTTYYNSATTSIYTTASNGASWYYKDTQANTLVGSISPNGSQGSFTVSYS